MGLDMYLYKKTFIWSNEKGDLKISHPKYTFDPEKVRYVIEEAGYWRKANMIHKWFVENVQDGEDDCGNYYVPEEAMKELLETVNKVLAASELVEGEIKNGERGTKDGWEPIMQKGKYIKDPTVAQELLPTREGFFYGNTEYNEFYYQDLVDTKKILEQALEEGGDYEYHSSW